MAMIMHPSLAVHPGDWLKSEVVDPHGVSINRLAACFHVTRQTLSNLFNGHTALSADMAIRFEKAFGVKADTLMRMQTKFSSIRFSPSLETLRLGFVRLNGLELQGV
jgi:addiction module HigA family antidote